MRPSEPKTAVNFELYPITNQVGPQNISISVINVVES